MITARPAPLPAIKVDPACMLAGKHVDCTCTAPPTQPADFAILRHRARLLAMLGLQSDRYALEPDFKDAVDRVLDVTHVYD